MLFSLRFEFVKEVMLVCIFLSMASFAFMTHWLLQLAVEESEVDEPELGKPELDKSVLDKMEETVKPSGGMMCQGMRKEIQTKGVIGPHQPFKDGWHNFSIVRRSGTGYNGLLYEERRYNPTLLNDSEMAAEGNSDLPVPDLRTMEKLCQPSLNGRCGPIAPIAIQATNFELKNDMI
nr:reverse transcriptase domain-containing protein [Tanacetum cinerariifolium]